MRVYASAEMTLTDTNDGISVTGIDRYYMASSSSSGITVDSKGWEPDPQETNPISRYHWSYEVVNYSDGAKIPSKPAVIGVYGKEGKEGIDAVTVSLSSEAHTFAGTESKAIASSITINISAFKGNQRISTSIGTVTGGIAGQLEHSELGRGTTSNRLVINATNSLSKANGTLSIPIVADGRTFNKVFSWSVAFKGKTGDKGDPGNDGNPGKNGVGIQKTELHYAVSTSGTNKPSTGWDLQVPSTEPGDYIWTRTTWTYTDGDIEEGYSVSRIGKDGNPGNNGKPGKDGVGITDTIISYAQSTSGVNAPTSGYTEQVPDVPDGHFLWTKTEWQYTDGTNEFGYSVSKMGEKGTPTYTWIRYADTPTSGMEDSPIGKKYIGLAFNQTTQNESNNYSDYQWSLMPQNIDIGGRNYFQNSDFSKGIDVYWTRLNSSPLKNFQFKDGLLTVKSDPYSQSDFGRTNFIQENNLEGQDYITVSSSVKGIGSFTVRFGSSNMPTKFINNNDFKPVIFVIPRENFGNGNLIIDIDSGELTFNRIKAEKGNTATDWTPAPEDTQSEIDDTKEQVKKTVKTITEEYYQSTSATSETGGRWTTTAPKWDANKFMFVRSKITYMDGTSDYTPTVNLSGAKGATGAQGPRGPQGPQGIQGPSGSNGQSQWVHIRYSANPTGSGMEPSPSSTTKYVGIAVTNSATAPPFPEFTWSKYVGENGDEGPRGLPGKNGTDGTTTYTWVRYADTPTSGMENFPEGKKYIGLAFNKTTQTESNNYSDYQWSLMPQNIEVGGRNLIGHFNIIKGGWVATNGSIPVDTNARVATEFIAIPIDTKNITFNYDGQDYPGSSVKVAVGLYDVEFGFIDRLTSGDTSTPKIFTIPENVAYIRLSYPTALRLYDDYAKLEKGNTATDWTPAPEDVQSQIDKSVKSTDVEYYLSTSSTSLAGGKWQTTAPPWDNDKYMWSRTKVVLNDGTISYNPNTTGTNITGAKGSTGSRGPSGKGVSSITEEYYLSDSKTSRVGGSWTSTAPTWSTGKYMWTRSKIVWVNPSDTTYTKPIVDTSWEAVNEIEIGGRNLLTNSTFKGGQSGWSIQNGTVKYIDGLMVSSGNPAEVYRTNVLNGLDTVTASVWVKGSGRFQARAGGGSRVGYTSFNHSTFKQVSCTFNDMENGNLILMLDGDNLEVEKVKLEKGNTATDWTPAPEDTQSELDKKAGSKELNDTLAIVREEREKLGDLRTELETTQSNLLITHSEEWMNTITETANDVGGMSNRVEIIEQTKEQIDTFFQFDDALTIAKSNAQTKLRLTNDEIQFLDGETKGTYITGNNMVTQNLTIQDKLNLPNHTMESQEDLTIIRFIG